MAESGNKGEHWNTTCWYWHLSDRVSLCGDSLTAGTSARAWQDQSIRHSHHGLEQGLITSGHKWWHREAESRGSGGKEEAVGGTRNNHAIQKGWKMGSASCLGFLFLFLSFLWLVFVGPYLWKQRGAWYSQGCLIFWFSECFCLMNHFVLLTDGTFRKNGFGVRKTIRNYHPQWPRGSYEFDCLLPWFTGWSVPCTAKCYPLIL